MVFLKQRHKSIGYFLVNYGVFWVFVLESPFSELCQIMQVNWGQSTWRNVERSFWDEDLLMIDILEQGWPTRGPRAACGPEKNFCGPNLDWNSAIFRYFGCFFTVFIKIWRKKSIFLEIFPNAAQRPIWVGHPCFRVSKFSGDTISKYTVEQFFKNCKRFIEKIFSYLKRIIKYLHNFTSG